MGGSSTLSLRRQLFFAISFLLLPLFAAVTWSGWLSFGERRNELGQQAELLARTIAGLVNGDTQAMTDGLAAIPLPADALAAITDVDGRILAHRGGEAARAGTTARRRAGGVRRPYRSVDTDGVERMHAEASIGDGGRGVVSVALPVSIAYDRAHRPRRFRPDQAQEDVRP
jgi:hypothetical protein